MPPPAVGSGSRRVASGSCTTSPSAFPKPAIDRLQPALAWADMVLADYSKTPAEVAHIKPLLPSQKAPQPNQHKALTQTNNRWASQAVAIIPELSCLHCRKKS